MFSTMQSQQIATFAWSNHSRRIEMLALLLGYHIKEESPYKVFSKPIFPDALVKELQNYVQGGYIYVLIEQEQQKRWGEVSGYRQEFEQRNEQIKREYQTGVSMKCLSEKYGLSFYAVRKIIYQK